MNTLDSVVDALAKDPARKFVVVEQVSIQYSTVQYLPSLPDILLSLSSTLLVLHRLRSSVFSSQIVLVLVVCLQCLPALICSQSLVVYIYIYF